MRISSTIRKSPQRPRVADDQEKSEKPKSNLATQALDVIESASKAVDKKPILAHSLTAAAGVARSFKAFPNFVYPSVYNASATEQQQIYAGLDRLPLHHVNDIKAIEVVAEIQNHKPGYVTNGRAWDFHGTNHVELSRKELSYPDKWLRTQTHETGHAVDYESQAFKLFGERSSRNPFGKEPYISDYATTNAREDFAESYEEFFVDPENLKQKAPKKYEAIEKMTEQSFLQRMVDRKEFRETGKYVADTIGPSKVARHTVQSAYYLSSVLQIGHGVSQWLRSKETEDPMAHTSGILNTLSGSLFFTGMTPLVGMAVQGANTALSQAVRKDRLSAEEVESSVAFLARPVEGLLGREKTEIKDAHRPGRVAAVAAGGAIGGTAGALIGPYAGVMAGYHLAGGFGGAIGMVAGGLVGFVGGSTLGGKLGSAAHDLISKPDSKGMNYLGSPDLPNQ
jgi:hypothetical protein